jgi:mRNA interferase MazF
MDELRAMLERIIAWTKIKCRLQAAKPEAVYFKEREIWWAHLGENIGQEQNGKNDEFDRPVLVVKKFNAYLLLILPLTTKDKEGMYYMATSHEDGQKPAKVVLSQVRTISAKRLIKKQRTLPESEFEEVRRRLKEMI